MVPTPTLKLIYHTLQKQRKIYIALWFVMYTAISFSQVRYGVPTDPHPPPTPGGEGVDGDSHDGTSDYTDWRVVLFCIIFLGVFMLIISSPMIVVELRQRRERSKNEARWEKGRAIENFKDGLWNKIREKIIESINKESSYNARMIRYKLPYFRDEVPKALFEVHDFDFEKMIINTNESAQSVVFEVKYDTIMIFQTAFSAFTSSRWEILRKGIPMEGPFSVPQLKTVVWTKGLRIRRVGDTEWNSWLEIGKIYPELISARVIEAIQLSRNKI